MRTVLLKELSSFSVSSFATATKLSIQEADACINALLSKGVFRLKSRKNIDYFYGNDYEDDIQYPFVLAYVGLIMYEDIIIISFPKYLNAETLTLRKLRQIIDVVKKYGNYYSYMPAISDYSASSVNRLSLMLALYEAYFEYGVYTNDIHEYAQNGKGSISWERTISKHLPYMGEGVPIYFDFETIELNDDSSYLITRLHKSVLTSISSSFRETGLADLLSLDDIELSEEAIEDLGDIDYLSYQLEHEFSIQFVTWKQSVIQLMLNYIDGSNNYSEQGEVALFGTTSFYNIWERACKVALGDLLNETLNTLSNTQFILQEFHDNGMTLQDMVPRPKWYWNNNNTIEVSDNFSTLIPDIVTMRKRGSGEKIFAIFDAKYYSPKLWTKLEGVPGVESISKQFLYQRAYRDFIRNNSFTKVINTFLIPTDGLSFHNCGRVEFPGVFQDEQIPLSNAIRLVAMPAEKVWECYLANKVLHDKEIVNLFAAEESYE